MCDVNFCCIETLTLECFGYRNDSMHIIKFVCHCWPLIIKNTCFTDDIDISLIIYEFSVNSNKHTHYSISAQEKELIYVSLPANCTICDKIFRALVWDFALHMHVHVRCGN